jgi:hypothetical protein
MQSGNLLANNASMKLEKWKRLFCSIFEASHRHIFAISGAACVNFVTVAPC